MDKAEKGHGNAVIVRQTFSAHLIYIILFKVQLSDVARPLSYKTKITYFFKTKTGQAKTTFSRPRPFFKDHQIIKFKTTGVARNFDWEGPKLEKILWRYFGDVSWWRHGVTSLKWRHNYILKFDFVIISFKTNHLAKLRNFKSPILKIKRH